MQNADVDLDSRRADGDISKVRTVDIGVVLDGQTDGGTDGQTLSIVIANSSLVLHHLHVAWRGAFPLVTINS